MLTRRMRRPGGYGKAARWKGGMGWGSEVEITECGDGRVGIILTTYCILVGRVLPYLYYIYGHGLYTCTVKTKGNNKKYRKTMVILDDWKSGDVMI